MNHVTVIRALAARRTSPPTSRVLCQPPPHRGWVTSMSDRYRAVISRTRCRCPNQLAGPIDLTAASARQPPRPCAHCPYSVLAQSLVRSGARTSSARRRLRRQSRRRDPSSRGQATCTGVLSRPLNRDAPSSLGAAVVWTGERSSKLPATVNVPSKWCSRERPPRSCATYAIGPGLPTRPATRRRAGRSARRLPTTTIPRLRPPSTAEATLSPFAIGRAERPRKQRKNTRSMRGFQRLVAL